MPAVINVGGPVAWGLVVLVSAWAVRAVKALARRHQDSRKGQDDDLLPHDPNTQQPHYLQRLSATAIRMLIETGALPCAVLELADAGGNTTATASSSTTTTTTTAASTGNLHEPGRPPTQGPAAAPSHPGPAGASPQSCRIVPTELAVVVPCMSVAAWVRAFGGAESWRSELARAASADAAAAASSASGTGGIGSSSSGGGARDGTACNPVASKFPQDLLFSRTGGGGTAAVATSPLDHGQASGAISEAGGGANSSVVPPYPSRNDLVVVLGRRERAVAAVTAAAAAAGFSRVGVWVGPADSFAVASLDGPRLPAISRHALWLVLQLGHEPLFHVPALVLDVRRPDERLLYGAIRGTVNIPADELQAALALPAGEFRRRLGVAKPGRDDVVVLHSRAGRRAAWAAQVCWDAGLRSVFVYGEGVNGWRFEDRVKPYRLYQLGAPPPDPEPFSPEEPDEALGLQELHALGLPMREGPRPSRFELAGDPVTGRPAAAPPPPPPPLTSAPPAGRRLTAGMAVPT